MGTRSSERSVGHDQHRDLDMAGKTHMGLLRYLLALFALGLAYLAWNNSTPWFSQYLGTLLGSIAEFLLGAGVVLLILAVPTEALEKVKF